MFGQCNRFFSAGFSGVIVILFASSPTNATVPAPVENAGYVLDDYSSSANLDAGKYTEYVSYGSAWSSNAFITTLDGELRVYAGSRRSVNHLWNGGESLKMPGDAFEIQVNFAEGTGTSAKGVWLDSVQEGSDDSISIRMYYDSYHVLKGPWGDLSPEFYPDQPEPYPFKIRITLLSITDGLMTLLASCTGTTFSPIEAEFEASATELYFGFHTYNSLYSYEAVAYEELKYIPGPYTAWALQEGLTLGVNDGLNDDPNGDGISNGVHYAINTRPLAEGSSTSPTNSQHVNMLEISEDSYFSMTVPVRKGILLSGTGPFMSETDEGFRYVIEAASDVDSTWDAELVELTLASSAGLPLLGDIDGDSEADWEYRTFRLSAPVSQSQRGFMRVRVEEP